MARQKQLDLFTDPPKQRKDYRPRTGRMPAWLASPGNQDMFGSELDVLFDTVFAEFRHNGRRVSPSMLDYEMIRRAVESKGLKPAEYEAAIRAECARRGF